MRYADFHVHTRFCDGANTVREMVESAIKKGLSAIGFSAHSYTFFDESYCMKKEETEKYQAEVLACKGEYQDKIRVLLGIEQDLYSDMPTDGYDYVIGSVHYLKKDGKYYSVDSSAEGFQKMAETVYGGDYYALCEAYFDAVSSVASVIRPTFIGHFDLVCKFNEKYNFFDETHPRYVAAWQRALDTLLPLGIPFEVNTGAMSRGYKTVPYPSRAQLQYIKEKGGKVILSGDTHACNSLCFDFPKWERELLALHIPMITL